MDTSEVQEKSVRISKNTARRGRFPARLNSTCGPLRFKVCPDSQENNINNFHVSDSQNSITDSQKDTVPSENDNDVNNISDPRICKSTLKSSSVTSCVRGRGGVHKTLTSRSYQKLNNGVWIGKNHPKTPPLQIKSHLKSLNFDEQVKYFLESSRDGNLVPFLTEDVIPATPERPSQRFSNAVKRKTSYIGVIKKSGINLSHTESVNETNKQGGGEVGQNAESKSGTTPEKTLNASAVRVESMPRKQQDVSKPNDAKSARGLSNKSRERRELQALDSAIPDKIDAVSKRLKKLIEQVDKSKTESENDGNKPAEKTLSLSQIPITGRISRCETTSRANLEPLQTNAQNYTPVQEREQLPKGKRVLKRRGVSGKEESTHSSERVSNEVGPPPREEGRSDRTKKTAVKEAPSNTALNNKDSEEFQLKVVGSRKVTRVVDSLPVVGVKNSREKIQNKSAVDEGGAKQEAGERKIPVRKRRGVNKKGKESDAEFVKKTVSKSSVVSTVSTRSQRRAADSQGQHAKSFIDEFFEKNCTMNDKCQAVDPKVIRRMNASSSDESQDEDDEPAAIEKGTLSQKKISQESVKVAQMIGSPAKKCNNPRVSLNKSPRIERMVKRQCYPEEAQLKNYVAIDLGPSPQTSPKSTLNTNRKRRLYSDKFEHFVESDLESPKKVKKSDTSGKKVSVESAQIYVDIEEERKKVAGGEGRAKGGKRQKNTNKQDQIKLVEVPKTVEPSLNANYSYRRHSNENKANDLFDMVKDNGKNVYSDFDDSSSEKGKNVKKRRATQRKAASKGKQPKHNNVFEHLVNYENNPLIDERVRAGPVANTSESQGNMFEFEVDEEFNVPPAVPDKPPLMLQPDDDPQFDYDAVVHGEENVKEDTVPEESHKAEKNKPQTKNSKRNKKNNNKTPKATQKVEAKKIEVGDMDMSLPSLIVEESQREANNDSLVGRDFDKLKSVIGDTANITTDTSMVDMPQQEVEVVRSVHFDVGNARGSNVDVTDHSAPMEHADVPATICPAPQNSLDDLQKQMVENIMKDSPVRHICTLQNCSKCGGSKSPGTKRTAIVLLANTESLLHDCSSDDSESEASLCSIILSSRQCSQASSKVTIDDISNMFDTDTYNRSNLGLSKQISFSDRSYNMNPLERISEESIQRSVHSTPKSTGSLDYTKYLQGHISPLRMPTSTVHSEQVLECGDGSSFAVKANKIKKTGSLAVQSKRIIQSSTRIGGKLSKGNLHDPSRGGSASTNTNERSVKSPLTKRRVSKSGTSFFVPKSESDKKYKELGCCIRTTLDVWCTQLSTMEQHLFRFRKEIDSFKQGLFSDCCMRHKKNV